MSEDWGSFSPASSDYTGCECCGHAAENCNAEPCKECGKMTCSDCGTFFDKGWLCETCAEEYQLEAEMDDEEMEERIHGPYTNH